MNYNRLKKLHDLKKQISILQEQEKQLRIEVVDELAKEQPIGTKTYTVGNSKIKIKKSVYYKFDQEALTFANLSEEEAECVKWTPSLSISKYKSLTDSKNLDECLYTIDAMPSVEITL